MNVLFITTYKKTLYGAGAASATLLLAGNLEQAGHRIKILSREDFVAPFDCEPLFQLSAKNTFSASPLGKCDEELLAEIDLYDPDVVVLGAIDREIMSPLTIREIKKPTILIFHDLYPVTGGCLFQGGSSSAHIEKQYSFYEMYQCQGYRKKCEICPLVGGSEQQALVQLNYRLKKEVLLARKDIVLAPVSKWMQDILASIPHLYGHTSKLLYNTIDEKIFKPQDNQNAIRKKYELPFNKKIGLLVTDYYDSKGKGFSLFLDTLPTLKLNPKQIEFCAMGAAVSVPKKVQFHGFTFHFLGYISDIKEKANVYNVSDLFISTSVHENLPMVCLESLSCGTPLVAYGVGGIASDILKHKYNGYLAEPFVSEDLANGIRWLCELSPKRYREIVENGQIHMENKFASSTIVKQFEEISELAKWQYQKIYAKPILSQGKRQDMQAIFQYTLTHLRQTQDQVRQTQDQVRQTQDQLRRARQGRWYRFGQLSRKRKLWAIAKVLSKKLRVYTLLRPAAKFIERILRKA